MSNAETGNEGDLLTEEGQQSTMWFDCARKVLLAGIWLIENGHGQMRLLPYIYATGHWRCEFHPVGKPTKSLYRYSVSSEQSFLASHSGGNLRKDISPNELAKAIWVSVPDDIKDACVGKPSREMSEWCVELRQQLDLCRIPSAFGQAFCEPFVWQLTDFLASAQGLTMLAIPGYVQPSERLSCLDDCYWKPAEIRSKRLAKLVSISLPSFVLNDDEVCFEIGNRLRKDMADANHLEAMRLLRASIGALHIEAGKWTEKFVEIREAKVSTDVTSSLVVKRATRLLSMVHELHKVGYQKLRVAPGWDPLGRVWRARLMPASCVSEDGWSPASGTLFADYSSDQGKAFFGWIDTESDNARALAKKFLLRFPKLSECCYGRDWAYTGWFATALGYAENGELPAFYGGIINDRVDLPPPPLGVVSQSGPRFVSVTGFPVVPNDELTLAMLPVERASYLNVYSFCLTFDGYKGGLLSAAECWSIASMIERDGFHCASLDGLRTCAFIHQRALKNQAESGPIKDNSSSLITINAVIDEIRRRLS